jgi:hypothetical protein
VLRPPSHPARLAGIEEGANNTFGVGIKRVHAVLRDIERKVAEFQRQQRARDAACAADALARQPVDVQIGLSVYEDMVRGGGAGRDWAQAHALQGAGVVRCPHAAAASALQASSLTRHAVPFSPFVPAHSRRRCGAACTGCFAIGPTWRRSCGCVGGSRAGELTAAAHVAPYADTR